MTYEIQTATETQKKAGCGTGSKEPRGLDEALARWPLKDHTANVSVIC